MDANDKKLDELTKEFQAELSKRGLPQMSADELLHEDLSEADRRYVSDFYNRWQAVENAISDAAAMRQRFERNQEICVIMANRFATSILGAACAPLKNVPAMPRYYAEKLADALNADVGSANVRYTVEKN